MIEPSREEITRAVESLLAAQTWDEKKRLVEAQRSLLLNEAADQVFSNMLEQKRDSADATRLLEEHRDLVARCRQDGIELAFVGFLLPTELLLLLAEIDRLTRTVEMPRKIEACRAALQLLDRTREPQQWGMLQNLLADSLIKNPLGSRAETLEQAIFHCEQALTVYTREAFPQDWAATQLHLAKAYTNRIRGEKAANIEQAISHCEQALTVYTLEEFPTDWAKTQHELASAYLFRIRGERADNLEQAISSYREALEVRTREAYPVEWSQTKRSLANAYRNRIRGERAENLEQAISYYQQTLDVYTCEAFPEEWATTLWNLAGAYSNRIRGERAANLEQAISYYHQALDVYTREAFPRQWAATQDSLASAYRNRIQGERADNLEQAIFHYQQALEVGTRETLPRAWASTQHNLAGAYSNRIRGERADNLEQAIFHFEQALQVRTRESLPVEWALTQHGLAYAYSNRIRGERAENLEQAIFHYEQALQVYTRDSFPVDWARTQTGLAGAYRDRIRGERADNLEQAISHCEQALQVFTRESFPFDWAGRQVVLGMAYVQRIRGERADNLEQGIFHTKQALQVFTRESFPSDWAATLQNLAYSYGNRIHGDLFDNLEQAISSNEQALQIYTRDSFPVEWATTQRNLAIDYAGRIRGDKAANLEQALFHCQQALQVYTRESFPSDWARSQYFLATVFLSRIRGERADNLEQAISHCEQALQVYIRDSFTSDWARIQTSLAGAYRDRIQGERADNLEQAISHFEQALQVFSRESFPFNWAGTQFGLAVVYTERIQGDHADNLEQAISHYHQALEVHTPTAYPHYCRDTAYALGCLLYDLQRYPEARTALETAHQAIEAIRGETQRDISKRSLAKENADLYARLVSSCLHEQDAAAAFRYAVAGKGRAFVDQLASIRLDPSALEAEDPALAQALRTDRALRQQIDAMRNALLDGGDSSLTGASFSHQELPAQLATLQQQAASHWEELVYNYPALTATQQAPALSVEQACALANELGATLVEYYCHREGWCAFIVNAQDLHYVSLPLVNDDLLARMVSWVQQIQSPSGTGRNPLSYRRLSDWYESVFAPVSTYLSPQQPLILAPFGQLHVLPLAAARHPQTDRFVGEDYELSFSPSLGALQIVREQARRTGGDGSGGLQRLLNVAYPGTPDSPHYLPNVLPEAETIAASFTQVTPLYGVAATPDAVLAHSREQDVVHFGCHGWFDAEQPGESGLLLSGGMLTIQRILNELRLNQARIATLGACESGRAALQSGDEYTGLMQAMLTTGVQAVVASLWKVDDDATYALFADFYARLVAGHSPAQALQEAARLVREHPEHPHWAHPYYWAAFQVSGLTLEAYKST